MKWISTQDAMPDGPGNIVKVKLENGNEKKCYYHRDKMIWLAYYNAKTSHFQCYETLEFLHNVTHWKYLQKHE